MRIQRKWCALLNTEWNPELQTIEVAMPFQLPNFQIIGLAGPEVAEARERIRAAFEESELEFPKRKVVVNLAPARIRKQGTGADLAIALAVLDKSLTLHSAPEPQGPIQTETWVASGELGLDGKLRPTHQPIRTLLAGIRNQADVVVFPDDERAVVQSYAHLMKSQGMRLPRIFSIASLKDAPALFREDAIKPLDGISAKAAADTPKDCSKLLELSWIDRTAIGIACSGKHHLFLLGPRGAGKTHLLDWIRYLRPESAPSEKIEKLSVQELWIQAASDGATSIDPFVFVSPSVRPSALIGSFQKGQWIPGSLSRAHQGVLVADEFAEWSRDSRETLREPLESGSISLTRAGGHLRIASRFQWLGTSNLCPCGGWPLEIPVPDHLKKSKLPTCTCSKTSREAYWQRITGPVLDRIDILWFMAARSEMGGPETQEARSPENLANQVRQCQARLLETYSKLPSEMSSREIQDRIQDSPGVFVFPSDSSSDESLSLRRRHKWARLTLTASAWLGAREPTQAGFWLAKSLFSGAGLQTATLRNK